VVVAEFVDCASGAKSGKDRPEFEKLQKAAARRGFDLVMTWSIDRLGRRLKDLIDFLAHINSLGIDLFVLQQSLDSTTPGGKAMFNMLAVLAEYERGLIRERVMAGLARARAEGRKLGRPSLPKSKEAEVREALVAGYGTRRIARDLRVGLGSVARIKARMAAEAGVVT
jgi:DNA invertase Pin-like site-specific DNA recombinase